MTIIPRRALHIAVPQGARQRDRKKRSAGTSTRRLIYLFAALLSRLGSKQIHLLNASENSSMYRMPCIDRNSIETNINKIDVALLTERNPYRRHHRIRIFS